MLGCRPLQQTQKRLKSCRILKVPTSMTRTAAAAFATLELAVPVDMRKSLQVYV